ncbi:FlgK family flagellar hook-associated protein [Polynucleobacter sp.]|uniref:FlgK family flagellar hook-associated protein n=1 Tax=Polynucleobacter sp. TaxID=2029855 RepID=UPI003F6A34F0
MGIYSLTDSAMAGLNIAQAGILTTSQNVAGTSVEGYSRRNANVIMDSLAPNSLMLNGSSFAVEGFTRHYSSLIGSQLLIQQSKSSYSDTLVQYTNSVDSLVADKSTGLNTAISNFFNAMGAYAADPTNKAMAGAITGTAKEVAQRMTGMSTLVNQIQSDARTALTDTVAQVNTILPALADINQKIVDGNSPGVSAPSADLLDERDRLLSSLQQLVGGQSLINSDGTATQLVAGMPLVERAIANKVTINADQEHVALTFNLQNGPTKGVLTTVQNLDGGQAGALLELSNNFVPTVQKRLDTIAMGLVKVANSAAQTSSGLATNLAIFGFKVADKTYSSLATNDLSGNLPTIENENDLLDLYSSLGNAISSNSAVKVGNLVGSYTSISSLTAGSNTLAGDYTLTKVGTNQLNISDSSGKNQTVSLATSVSGGLQTVDFNQLGITLQLENFSPALSAVSSSSVVKDTATVGAQTISNMEVENNVQSGTYTFSSSGNQVTLTSSNGGSQTLTLVDGTAAGQTLNFSQMGISFAMADTGSPVETAAVIAATLNAKTITLVNAEDSQATIATALDGLKVKVSGMGNPLVNYGFSAANFISLAPTNFASYYNGNTPLITSEKANATQQMSAVFGSSISNLVNEVGVQVATWKNGQKADSVVLANLKAQRDSVSGVNLDEEAANLLKYQQLYTASTKVLQAGNQMFSTLLSIMN